MQAVPRTIELQAVEEALLSIDGVLAAHDLHAWSVTGERAILSVHLRIGRDVDRLADDRRSRTGALRDRFDVRHSTIQLECPADCLPCTAPGPSAQRADPARERVALECPERSREDVPGAFGERIGAVAERLGRGRDG